MKNILKRFALLGVAILVYSGCNSPTYEIIEVEEPVEIKEETKPPVTEIKEDIKPPENKFNEKTVISRNYVIQIGAFNDEENATKFTRNAKERIGGDDVTFKETDGLYKVRLGTFAVKSEALELLMKIKELGFTDSFLVEITYLKQENK
ncbi:MAG: SPOR domain-containing protein [Ignavibacteria bacterium]|nr:SPOR domain-containing protein [Ignavibacteria bacterium]